MTLFIVAIIFFIIAFVYGVSSEIMNALLPAAIIAAAILLSKKTKNDSEKSAHYKRSIALIASGVIVLAMGISENAGGFHHGLYRDIVIGTDPTLGIIGGILIIAGILYTVFGYMRYGERGSITIEEYKRHKKNLIKVTIAIIVIMLVAGIGAIHNERGKTSDDRLEAYKEEIIGKFYQDTKQNIYMGGDTIERRTIHIIDEKKLKFTESKGTCDNRGNIIYEGSVSNTETVSYELKRRIDGKIALYFNGKGHIAYFDVNNQSIVGFKLY